MNIEQVEGDLLDQDVDCIVNAWNRNVIPWWLLLPQGVSGAIKRRAGWRPFRELGWRPMPLGTARLTTAGRLPYRAIIHVAGINLLWRASEASIRDAARNAIRLAVDNNMRSVAFPIIGAGSGGFDLDEAERILLDALRAETADLRVVVVRYTPTKNRDGAAL